jgi:hypothetical protein
MAIDGGEDSVFQFKGRRIMLKRANCEKHFSRCDRQEGQFTVFLKGTVGKVDRPAVIAGESLFNAVWAVDEWWI